MEGAGEHPREVPTQPPTGEAVRLEAHASDQARVNQAARDLHVHYGNGVRGGRRAEPGAATAECPYPGLASFGREQARWFFGRERLTAELIARLDARLRTGGVQAVVAPSGAGKSSLLHAGLLPQLGDGALPGSARWPTVVFTPTAQPLQALAIQIAALTDADPVAVAEQLAADSQQAGAVLLGHIRGVDSGTRLVIVVDQFEELFTLCTDDRQRRTFIELLAQIAGLRSAAGSETQPMGLVVVGVRADFYAACVNYPHLRTALQDSPLAVGPMSDAELRAAILHPAQEVGLDVEPGLIEVLLRDLGDTTAAAGEDVTANYEAGRLPLLAHTLRATWQQRHGHILTVEGYRVTGGIHRAVATTADDVFTGLDPAGQHAARTLFLRLIKIGDGTEDTRRRMARTDLLQGLDPGSALPVLDAFTQGRLLTQDQDTVEITHEALVRAWPRLRQWIETDRAGNLTRQELDEATAVWDRNRRDTATLYRGSRLEVARSWAASTPHKDDLSPTASAFLAASTHQERRAAKLRRTVLVVLSILTLIAATGAVVAFRQSDNAQRERDNATFNQIIAQADRLGDIDVSLAAQLNLTAYRMRPTPDLYTDLITTGNAPLSTQLTGHTSSVRSGEFSPDRHTLASASGDRTVRLWDLIDPAHPTPLGQPLTGHTGAVNSIAFSPDGHTLASASDDRTVRLWNLTDPARPTPLGQPLTGHTSSVWSVSFSPDGRVLASAGFDQTVRLWDLTDPAHATSLGQPLTGHTSYLLSVAFSPDGHTLASASNDRTVRLWNLTDPAHPTPLGQPLTGHTGAVESIAFSPDGHTLASASVDQTVRLWNLTDPGHPLPLDQPLTGHTGTVFSVAFSPDGHTLASASGDQTVRLWNLTDPAPPIPPSQLLTGHTGTVFSVAFSLDGHTLASASDDQTVRLWNIPYTALTGHTGYVSSVAFNHDGRILASASLDRTVSLWGLTDPAHATSLGQSLTDHTGTVSSVAFSPDGRILASASTDRTVRLWDLTDSGHPLPLGQPLTGHTSYVNSVAFSPDGRILASAGFDQTVRLWDLTDPAHATSLGQPLTGHTSYLLSVAFSPDGHTLASASDDQTVRLWDLTDPAHPTPLSPPLTDHINAVDSIAFSPDGHTLASASGDQTVRLWDLTDPAHPTPLGQPLTGHTGAVGSVAFSPDGRILASAGFDQTVRLWDLTDPAHATSLGQPLTGHTSYVLSVAFSPDGHTLASASDDRTVRLWMMNVNQAIQRICAITRDTLTPAKWEQYVSKDLPYNPPCP